MVNLNDYVTPLSSPYKGEGYPFPSPQLNFLNIQTRGKGNHSSSLSSLSKLPNTPLKQMTLLKGIFAIK